MGLSSYRIAKRSFTDYLYVKSVIKDYFNFPGWDNDLDFSPLAVYSSKVVNGNKDAYALELRSNYTDAEKFIELSYLLCKRYTELEGELNGYN